MTPPLRKGRSAAVSTIQPRAGHLTNSLNDDFKEDDVGIRRRNSDSDQVKSGIVKKSFLKSSQQEQEEFDDAIRDLKRTSSREKGLRSQLNPKGQYIREEDG
jgi:hypothetical protein